jgi:hypothetical protein
MPFLAITLVVLLGFAGLGVDFWQWWHASQRLQRAADAGALAGVIYMPANSSSARSTATDAAGANGYAASGVQIFTSSDEAALRPNQLRVQVTQTVRNGFLGVFGIHNTTIRRDAIAEYSGTVPMGSPINQMGNQPTPPGDTNWPGASTDVEATNPHVWAQIAGPGNSKGNGDRFTSGLCSSGFHACSNGSTNDDFRSSILPSSRSATTAPSSGRRTTPPSARRSTPSARGTPPGKGRSAPATTGRRTLRRRTGPATRRRRSPSTNPTGRRGTTRTTRR